MIDKATAADVPGLARLLWLDTRHDEPVHNEPVHDEPVHNEPAGDRAVDEFAADLARWWAAHEHSHHAYVARGPEIVGMAWVALLPRVPRPGAIGRLSADIQSVFVRPEQRGQGIGSALVQAAVDHATALGAVRVTVHSGRRAVPVYERLGFTASRQLLQRTATP